MFLSEAGRDYMLRLLAESGVWLRLFVNDIDPADGDTAEMYQEPTRGGYQPILIPTESWRVGGGVAVCDPMTFTFDGPAGPVHGYFLTGIEDEFITATRVGAEPEIIRAEGDEVVITVTVRMGQLG